MISIRKYESQDSSMIDSWCKLEQSKESFCDFFLSPTTYIAEINEKPVLCASLIFTNAPYIALIENVIGNPEMVTERKEALAPLVNYLVEMAKDTGKKIIFMNSYVDKLKEKYESLGFKIATNNLSVLIKTL